jgi:hypothetical protein
LIGLSISKTQKYINVCILIISMAYKKDENKRTRMTYRSTRQMWAKLKFIQEHYRLRTREDAIDLVINEKFRSLENVESE